MELLKNGAKATLKMLGLKSGSKKENNEYTYFKDKTTFERRKMECIKVLSKNPNKLPLIIEPEEGCNVPIITKSKILITNKVTVGQMLLVLKEKMNLGLEKSLIIKCNGSIVPSNRKLLELYDESKEDDGFLYLRYCEATYG